jgi:hypothetical protein
LNASAKQIIPLERETIQRIGHAIFIYPYSPLTPLKALRSKACDDKLDSMFESLGTSFVTFNKEQNFPAKRFFNEMTAIPNETAHEDLALSCLHIINPFSAIIGQAGFNNHARLILQY